MARKTGTTPLGASFLFAVGPGMGPMNPLSTTQRPYEIEGR